MNSQSDIIPSDYQAWLETLKCLIAPLQALHQQAIEAYESSVWRIIHNGSRDTHRIEHTLDRLLDHACIPQGLALFKVLCRYYWQIDQQATADYVNAYREIWDSDGEEETEVVE